MKKPKLCFVVQQPPNVSCQGPSTAGRLRVFFQAGRLFLRKLLWLLDLKRYVGMRSNTSRLPTQNYSFDQVHHDEALRLRSMSEAAVSGCILPPAGGFEQKTPESVLDRIPAYREYCLAAIDQAHPGSHIPSGSEIARCCVDPARLSDHPSDVRLNVGPGNPRDTRGTLQ